MKIKIAVITATYNAQKYLPNLIDALAKQTDNDFEWIVADGASTDNTLTILEKSISKFKNLIIDSRKDSGISDAINRGIALIKSDYYIILGADDILFQDTISNFKKSIELHEYPDILVARVKNSDDKILVPRKPSWMWLYGSQAKVASTSIGTAYKRTLNDKIGYFDTRFKIYADGHFMMRAIKSGATINNANFIAGVFFTGGLSNSNPFISYTEDLRAKLMCGYSIYIQLILFSLRLIRASRKINIKDI